MSILQIFRWIRRLKLTPMKIGLGFLIGFPLGVILASQTPSGLVRIAFGLALGIALEIAISRFKRAYKETQKKP